MPGISKHNSSNIGGLKSLQILELSGVSTNSDGLKIPMVINGEVAENITVSAASQHAIYIMESQGTLRIDSAEQSAGFLYTVRLVFFIPATRLTATALLDDLKRKHCVALATDENGNIRLLGNDQERIEIDYKEANIQNRNGYEVTVTCSSAGVIPFFTGSVLN